MIKVIIKIDDSDFDEAVDLYELKSDIRRGIVQFAGIPSRDLEIEATNEN